MIKEEEKLTLEDIKLRLEDDLAKGEECYMPLNEETKMRYKKALTALWTIEKIEAKYESYTKTVYRTLSVARSSNETVATFAEAEGRGVFCDPEQLKLEAFSSGRAREQLDRECLELDSCDPKIRRLLAELKCLIFEEPSERFER